MQRFVGFRLMAKPPPFDSLLREVSDAAVREAFRSVDRERFVPWALKLCAWDDRPLPIGEGATISQPSLVAKMTEWLQVKKEHHVLEIGTGSGYQTALLAELAKSVYTVEINAELSASASERLAAMGYGNIKFYVGTGDEGWPTQDAFDRILATAAFTRRPDALLQQLKAGGICIAPIGPPNETQQLMCYTKGRCGVKERPLIPVRFLSML